MRISIIMVLFKTNGPVKIHIQCIITKSVYSLFPLWLDLRTVVVTSACLIPSFHCPSSHWISPRMLWNIKEKRVRFTNEPLPRFTTHHSCFDHFITFLLTRDLIRNISMSWHSDNITGTHGGRRRDLWGMGLNFWWHRTKIYNIQGVDTQ